MRPNDSFVGQSVRALQTMLRILAKDDPSLYSVIPDGIFGAQTRAAVSAFQRKYGMAVTGVVDQQTWDKIVAEQAPARIRLEAAQPLQLILNAGQVIRRGESHPYLYLVQSMLLAMNTVYASVPAPVLSGVLDAPTADSLCAFQRLCSLPQSGQLDKITWKHLALQYPLAVNLAKSENRQRK